MSAISIVWSTLYVYLCSWYGKTTYNWILKLHDILKGKETFIISGYFYTQKKTSFRHCSLHRIIRHGVSSWNFQPNFGKVQGNQFLIGIKGIKEVWIIKWCDVVRQVLFEPIKVFKIKSCQFWFIGRFLSTRSLCSAKQQQRRVRQKEERQKEERRVWGNCSVRPAQRDYYRSTARGSRNSSAPACNLLKRGRNMAKLFCDWLKIQNGFQNYFKNGWNELFFLNQVLKQFFFENIDKKWILGWSQKARIEEELILITFH